VAGFWHQEVIMQKILTAGLALVLAGCVETSAPNPAVLTVLTAAQAAAVDAKLDQAVAGSAELGWLADSASLVIRAGGTADTVTTDIGLGDGPTLFYGVSLQRGVAILPNPFATFDAILFNDLANPTRFVIVSGWARGGTTPPDGMAGNVASPQSFATVNAHVFAVEGSAVTHWRATTGTVIFNNGIPGGPCPVFNAIPGVTCAVRDLITTATISAMVRESGTMSGSPALNFASERLRGILLAFLPLPESP
jgi:hypothetical protein